MSVLFVLIGISLIIALAFLAAFIFSVKKGQYEDTYSPAHRILFDNNESNPKTKEEGNTE